MYTYGIDVGGTTVKIGIAEINGTQMNLLRRFEIKTNKENNGEMILPDIVSAINRDISENGVERGEICGLGLGVPGPVLPDGTVNRCINLGWGVFNVERSLSELSGFRVKAGNDANVAALGEMAFGAGVGFRNLIMLTLGTGVGGGIVVDGQIFRGSSGASGEIGHMHVNDAEGEACKCGNYGCLEQYASASGIVRTYENKIAKGSMQSLQGLTGLTCKDVFDNAKKGNGKAIAAIDYAAECLGKAMANAAAVINPEVFVIGGSVMNAGDFLLDKIKENYKRYAFHACKNAQIVQAKLGGDAGIYGAAFLATLG